MYLADALTLNPRIEELEAAQTRLVALAKRTFQEPRVIACVRERRGDWPALALDSGVCVCVRRGE